MKVLVIGYGGREHALVWKLRQSESVSEIFCAPGNPGIAEIADCVPIDSPNIVELADFALNVNINLTVVGPELPLDLGIVDEFQKRNLVIFGPTKKAAELESSKVFAKDFMQQQNIPTARFRTATVYEEGERIIQSREFSYPLVVKADGLAAGKGVTVCHDESEALMHLQTIMRERRFGNAGDRVVIEEHLQGEEVSFQVLSDGKRVLPLATSQDHKRLLDGDEGPNTGGMGAYSPAVYINKENHQRIMNEIVLPTISGMAELGRAFKGVLYAGLMLTTDGPKVLEFNARFGDPETQALIPRMDCDFGELLLNVAQGRLEEERVDWKKETCVAVILAAKGYPNDVRTGDEITGLEEAKSVENVLIFQTGTRKINDKLVSSGGRVLTVTAIDPHLSAASDKAYQAASRIHFEGMQYRTDIGKRAMDHLRTLKS